MKRLISAKLAANILLTFISLLLIFHVLIILGILPFSIVWGGQIDESKENLILLELIAIIILILFMTIIASKIGYIGIIKSEKISTFGLWIISVYFVLNAFGNLASDVPIENYVFAPLTIILALLSFRLTIEK